MFSWISTLKEKSKGVVQSYKNELQNMVSQLGSDINALKNEGLDATDSGQKDQIETELSAVSRTLKNLEQILDEISFFFKQSGGLVKSEENYEFLKVQIEFITSNLDSYFSKDPKQLVMVERDDFTNFHVFEEIPEIELSAGRVFSLLNLEAVAKKIVTEKQTERSMLDKRILYFLIYSFYEKSQQFVHKSSSLIPPETIHSEVEKQVLNNEFLKEEENYISQAQEVVEEEKKSLIQAGLGDDDDNWEIDENMVNI